MNEKQLRALIFGGVAVGILAVCARDVYVIRKQGRAKRKEILNDMGLDVAAIHNATDVVNARIENGEIRNYDELREAVLTEVAFQKIAIRED